MDLNTTNKQVNNSSGTLVLIVGSEPSGALNLFDHLPNTLDLRQEGVDWDEVFFQIFDSKRVVVW